MKETENGY